MGKRNGFHRLLGIERLEPRLAMIVEGSSFAIDSVQDTSGLLGTVSAQANWGDGTISPLTVSASPPAGQLRPRFVFLDRFFADRPGSTEALTLATEMVFSRFSDSLTAIEMGPGDRWNATYLDPSNKTIDVGSVGNIAANEILIFVQTHDFTDPNALASSGPGGFANAFGSATFLQSLQTRGQSGASGNLRTDFAAWGGVLFIDPNVNWHFGLTTDGLAPGAFDFVTIASHELFHLLGFGINFSSVITSWQRHVSNNQFLGPASVQANGGQPIPLSSGGGHWQRDTKSLGLDTLMDPIVKGNGQRILPTPLDLAGMVDVGWQLIPQQIRVVGAKAYRDNGSFPVSITLTGNRAGSRTVSFGTVDVTNSPPTLNTRNNQIEKAGIPIPIPRLGVFQDNGFGPTEEFIFEIDWGDGSPKLTGSPTIEQNGAAGIPTQGFFGDTHTYTTVGNYTVSYQITDDDLGTIKQSFVITITPAPALQIAIDRGEIAEDAGTNAALFLVDTVGFDNSQDIEVELISSDPTEAALPATITIKANNFRATTSVAAIDDTLLDGPQAVQLFARVGGLISIPITIQVLDRESINLALTVLTIREDGGPGAAVVRVSRSNTDTANPIDVQLTSSDPTAATLLPSVTIKANTSFIDVSITAVDDSIVDGSQSTLIAASSVNYEGSNVTLVVRDYEPLQWVERGLILAESNPIQTSILTLQLPAAAPSSGVTLDLTADADGQLLFPAQVSIAPGQTTATVSVSAINDTLAESPKTVNLIARRSGYEAAIIGVSLTDDDRSIWTNATNAFDTDGDGSVGPIDILQIINFIRRNGTGILPATRDPLGPPFVDINGNGSIEPIDILLIVNFLAKRVRSTL